MAEEAKIKTLHDYTTGEAIAPRTVVGALSGTGKAGQVVGFTEDSVIGLVEKQDTLTGTQGQVVGFDESGNAIAQAPPQTGMTEDEGDARYLQLTGGDVTGPLTIKTGEKQLTLDQGSYDGRDSLEFTFTTEAEGSSPVLTLTPGSKESWHQDVVISGVAAPFSDECVANKKYVDDALSKVSPVPYLVQSSPPDNHSIFWIDASNNNILKFWDSDSTGWLPIGSAWG